MLEWVSGACKFCAKRDPTAQKSQSEQLNKRFISNFSPHDESLIDQWARTRNDPHPASENRRRDLKRTDYALHSLGIRAEFYVWTLLGGVWLRHFTRRKDPGVDILLRTTMIQVKSTFFTSKNPYFYMPHWQRMVCDFGILVTPAGTLNVEIAGVCDRSFFELHAGPVPFDPTVKHGLHYSKLSPFSDVATELMDICRNVQPINATDYDLPSQVAARIKAITKGGATKS